MNEPLFFPEPAPHVREILGTFIADVASSASMLPGLRLLLLAGGYGRGEGGLLERNGRLHLYNDLEFYLFVDKPDPTHVEWVHRTEKLGHSRTGIEVEIKLLPLRDLQRARPSMFFYDLLAANVLVAGEAELLKSLPSDLSDPSRIPHDEAARLLMNRGCSLLRCARATEGNFEVPEGFIDRIAAKLKLALGDALLCEQGQYHWSCRERHRRLEARRDAGDTITRWHAEAVDFKFHPKLTGRSAFEWKKDVPELRTAWRDTFLGIEARRLGKAFASPSEYAHFSGRILPHESGTANAARRVRLALSTRTILPGAWTAHPREAVLRALALLINPDRRPDDLLLAAQILGVRSRDATAIEEACRSLWGRFQ